jgi:hypothetical protein
MMDDVNTIQEQLNKVYQDVLSKTRVEALKDKERLSAPLLIKVNESFLNATKRIMYIGKETNHWLTDPKISLDRRGLMGVYKADGSLDIDRLLVRYNKRMTQSENWKKNALFKQYKNIKDQLVDTEVGSGSIVWNNLFKMSYDRGRGYSKTSLGHSSALEEVSKEIFIKEIEILKPDILIFVTGASYDKVIKNYLQEYKTIEVVIPKKLWKFKYKHMVCYRTIHPDGMRFVKKELQEDYYQMIIDDIKKEN